MVNLNERWHCQHYIIIEGDVPGVERVRDGQLGGDVTGRGGSGRTATCL